MIHKHLAAIALLTATLFGSSAEAAKPPKLQKIAAVTADIWDGKTAVVLGYEWSNVVVLAGEPLREVYAAPFANACGGFFKAFVGLRNNAIGQPLIELTQCSEVRPDEGKPYTSCHPVFLGCARGKCAVLNKDGTPATCD
jgi:hypothetical protein